MLGVPQVLIRENGAEREIEARTDFMGLSVDKAKRTSARMREYGSIMVIAKFLSEV